MLIIWINKIKMIMVKLILYNLLIKANYYQSLTIERI